MNHAYQTVCHSRGLNDSLQNIFCEQRKIHMKVFSKKFTKQDKNALNYFFLSLALKNKQQIRIKFRILNLYVKLNKVYAVFGILYYLNSVNHKNILREFVNYFRHKNVKRQKNMRYKMILGKCIEKDVHQILEMHCRLRNISYYIIYYTHIIYKDSF